MNLSVVLPVYLPAPWLLPMARCAIETLKCTTSIEFELIVVETGSTYLLNFPGVDTHIYVEKRENPTADINQGVRAAHGDWIVYTGTDVFVRPDWLVSLSKCFAIADCGTATIGATELKQEWSQGVTEGIYHAFFAFRRGFEFDAENFPCAFADSDLMMQVAHSGLRSYRCCEALCYHLVGQTFQAEGAPTHGPTFDEAKAAFRRKWGASPLLMYRILNEGHRY